MGIDKKNKSIKFLLSEEVGIELVVCNHSMLSYPVHNHVSVYTIGLITDGNVRVTMEDELRYCKKGDVFIIPPYAPHSIQTLEQYSMCSLCIDKQILEHMEFAYIQKNVMKMLTLVKELSNLSKDKMLRAVYEITLLNKIKPKKDGNVDRVRAQLELFPEEKISIEEMAQLTFTSKYHFIRNFKQEIGLTPHRFQLQNRIRKAKKLLRQSEKITEVALDTGFCDQSHFIKQFEKIVGITPSRYVLACNEIHQD